MNKKQALGLLREYLEEYGSNFQFHPLFINELQDLLSGLRGSEKELFSLLVKQFNYIKQLKRSVYKVSDNEILRHQEGERDYYSIHLSSKKFNIRLLMTFNEDDNPIFLAAFYERQGKRKTDYSGWLEVIKTRLSTSE